MTSRSTVMNRRLSLNLCQQLLLTAQARHTGFSYIEAVVALLIAMAVFAATGPLFWSQRERNINSQINTGAAAIAQDLLEQQRLNFRAALPNLVETQSLDQTRMGNTYAVDTRIREFAGRNADGSINCTPVANVTSRARCLRVQVRTGTVANPGVLVYDVETVFTQIQ
jgi:type II secretory pathway pseudopilin PulG